MKHKVGDRVQVKSLDWYNTSKNKYGVVELIGSNGWGFNFLEEMSAFCGEVMTISNIGSSDCGYYDMKEDNGAYFWTDEMIECKVEEETKPEPKFKVGDKITNGTVTFTILTLASDRYFVEDNFGDYGTLYFKTRDDWKLVEEKTSIKLTGKAIKNDEMVVSIGEYALPEGYIFKDENGNVINATKIVLEKKKKEYPKTYEECYRIMDIDTGFLLTSYDLDFWKGCLLTSLQKLLICRNAYWKLYGEEMGLGKPWKPDWTDLDQLKYCIWVDVGEFITMTNVRGQHILAFPTEEMRDDFKENFDPDIEICKEFL